LYSTQLRTKLVHVLYMHAIIVSSTVVQLLFSITIQAIGMHELRNLDKLINNEV